MLPPEKGHDRRVRIFTPPYEVPFAGHPNIGTAFVLATMGAFGALDEPRTVVFEEDAGLVPVAITQGRRRADQVRADGAAAAVARRGRPGRVAATGASASSPTTS